MIPVGVIFNISGKIAEYLGFIESISTQVTKLVHQAFKSAKDNLEYARTASGQNQIDYVKRAKDLFIDAVAVEENENKILALVGLSMCQHLLGDASGAQRSLDRIKDVELTRAEKAKYAITDVSRVIHPIKLPFALVYGLLQDEFTITPELDSRIKSFDKAKSEAISTNRRLLT